MLLFLIKFAAFALGCVGCFALRSYGLSSISASAGLGLFATVLPSIQGVDRRRIHATVYAGTFAGMGSLELYQEPTLLAALVMLGALVYWFARPSFIGIGGKLGTIAFAASLLLFLGRSLR